MTHVRGLITLLITTHEPPSGGGRGFGLIEVTGGFFLRSGLGQA